MNPKACFFAVMALFALSLNAYGKPLQTFFLPVKQSPSFIYSLNVRVGVQERLAELATQVEKATRQDGNRPLIVTELKEPKRGCGRSGCRQASHFYSKRLA